MKKLLRDTAVLAVVIPILVLGALWLVAPDYFWNLMISVDQFGNTILFGDPDETISSRLGKWLQGDSWTKQQIATFICWFLDLFEADHCVVSIDPTRGAPVK